MTVLSRPIPPYTDAAPPSFLSIRTKIFAISLQLPGTFRSSTHEEALTSDIWEGHLIGEPPGSGEACMNAASGKIEVGARANLTRRMVPTIGLL
ncbi:hypothetical protein QE152_g39208 [Popillia japonica]|uniref:Uncharacterized protein n=1 Tax=Popillia japonica TaxID=7064 RepID=A0AAW1HUS7_POPJA